MSLTSSPRRPWITCWVARTQTPCCRYRWWEWDSARLRSRALRSDMDVGERVTSKRPEEPEHELSVTVDAIHRAADSIDHDFQVIEGPAADRRDSTIAHRDIAETPMRT